MCGCKGGEGACSNHWNTGDKKSREHAVTHRYSRGKKIIIFKTEPVNGVRELAVTHWNAGKK